MDISRAGADHPEPPEWRELTGVKGPHHGMKGPILHYIT